MPRSLGPNSKATGQEFPCSNLRPAGLSGRGCTLPEAGHIHDTGLLEAALPVTLVLPLTCKLHVTCPRVLRVSAQAPQVTQTCNENHIRVTSWILSSTPQGVETFWYVFMVCVCSAVTRREDQKLKMS